MRVKEENNTDFKKLIFELITKLNEFNRFVRETGLSAANAAFIGNYYAFDPSDLHDSDYCRKMTLVGCIYTVLNEYGINMKSRGYTYLKDALCILADYGSMDICLANDVYPLIRKKYRLKGNYCIEHNIRNAIYSAYRTALSSSGEDVGLILDFSSRPTNKEFILTAARRVHDMMAEGA